MKLTISQLRTTLTSVVMSLRMSKLAFISSVIITHTCFPNSLLLLNKLESLVCVIVTISAYTYTPSFNYPKQTSIDASANMKQTHFLCYLNIFLLGTPHLPLKSSKCKNGYYMAKSPYGIKSKTDKGSLWPIFNLQLTVIVVRLEHSRENVGPALLEILLR